MVPPILRRLILVSTNDGYTRQVTTLARLLMQKKWTVTAAESCTGGGVANAFTSLSGSSAWFEQSWVTYSNKAKATLLDVPESVLNEYGAVSAQTVEAMANGAAKNASADTAIAVSGIAGPGGGTETKPVGLVWFGFYIKGHVYSDKMLFKGDREAVRCQAIQYGLEKLNQGLVAALQ